HVWDFDHLASIGADGTERPVYEGWSLLAAIAASTRRVRFGCMVTGNTYRHPVVLAKMAVTVDHLSGGRLEFGIGAAWAEAEHQMYGIEGLDHRVGRLRESLDAMISLWTKERTTLEGRYYHFKDAVATPKPIQKPHPPIWIGAGGDQMMRVVAHYADVWNSAGGPGPDAAGDRALLVTLSSTVDPAALGEVLSLDRALKDRRPQGLIGTVTAYGSLLCHYDPAVTSADRLQEVIREFEGRPSTSFPLAPIVDVPTLYDGPDLA